MVNEVQFKVGDRVVWKPEHHRYRDTHHCPHSFVISDIQHQRRTVPLVFWEMKGGYNCPCARLPWLTMEEGPW